MKKVFLTLSALALTLGASAQLRVLNNGHVQLGIRNTTTTGGSGTGFGPVGGTGGVITASSSPDTTATISILGTGAFYSNGKISFGGNDYVSIAESTYSSNPNLGTSGAMILKGNGGIMFTASTGKIFSYDPNVKLLSGEAAFSFNVKTQAPQYLTTSDARCKSEIESLESYGKGLESLSPVSYVLNTNLNESASASVSAQAAPASKSRNFGFLAQEVREVYPELVHENADGMLCLDYDGFIPLLVDAYKSLSARVNEQEEIITNLLATQKKSKGVASISDIENEEKIVLMQNRPNPFRSETEIRCTLPESVKNAFICIYDLNGRQQKRIDISERGEVAVTVSANSLQPGMYIYSLIADGQEADTKRMILTE